MWNADVLAAFLKQEAAACEAGPPAPGALPAVAADLLAAPPVEDAVARATQQAAAPAPDSAPATVLPGELAVARALSHTERPYQPPRHRMRKRRKKVTPSNAAVNESTAPVVEHSPVSGRAAEDAAVSVQIDPSDHEAEVRALSGPARLAFFTPAYEQQSLADRKARFLLTACGLLATTLLFFLERIVDLLHAPRPWVSHLMVALLAGFGVSVLVAARHAYRAFVAPMPPMPKSLAFFGHVAEKSREEYVAGMTGLDYRRAIESMLHYNYSVAIQGAAKFRLVGRSLKWMRAAIPLWMLALVVISIWR